MQPFTYLRTGHTIEIFEFPIIKLCEMKLFYNMYIVRAVSLYTLTTLPIANMALLAHFFPTTVSKYVKGRKSKIIAKLSTHVVT